MYENLRVDKLKICYVIEEKSLIHRLRKEQIIDLQEEFGFKIVKILGDETDRYADFVYNILVPDDKNKGNNKVYGKLSFTAENENNLSKYAWISVQNKEFYSDYDHITRSELVYLEYIASTLHLCFNNISHLDICLDSHTYNFSKKIKSFLRNSNYNVIINNKLICDRKEFRDEIIYTNTGNLDRYKELTLYVVNKKKDIEVCCYNKKKEIEDNNESKSYILDANHNPKRLYRLEVRISKDAMKEFLAKNRILFQHSLLYNNDFLEYVFRSFLNRVIRFSQKRRMYEICDLISNDR